MSLPAYPAPIISTLYLFPSPESLSCINKLIKNLIAILNPTIPILVINAPNICFLTLFMSIFNINLVAANVIPASKHAKIYTK